MKIETIEFPPVPPYFKALAEGARDNDPAALEAIKAIQIGKLSSVEEAREIRKGIAWANKNIASWEAWFTNTWTPLINYHLDAAQDWSIVSTNLGRIHKELETTLSSPILKGVNKPLSSFSAFVDDVTEWDEESRQRLLDFHKEMANFITNLVGMFAEIRDACAKAVAAYENKVFQYEEGGKNGARVVINLGKFFTRRVSP